MRPKKNELSDEGDAVDTAYSGVFFILFALADGEKHGYAIMQQTTTLSEGKFKMGPGTLYTTIQRLSICFSSKRCGIRASARAADATTGDGAAARSSRS
jgi:hypothetical protein